MTAFEAPCHPASGDKLSPPDLQTQFEERVDRNDFLAAGKVEDVVGLCLSGGGYRAMIYHAGALVRLNEFGFLPRLREIASVSGGSITAAALALSWSSLKFDRNGRSDNLAEALIIPVIRLASTGIDVKAALVGLLPGYSAAGEIEKAYDRHLFHGATLQDLPDQPRFTFMATNLQTGSSWRFAKGYAADYRVGRINRPTLPLSKVVAASSAFPPFLSPVRLSFDPGTVQAMDGADMHKPPFIEGAILTDGGVYDNLGLERVWRRCRTILVSNAGRSTPELGAPSGRWIGQIFRTLHLVQQQAENSRMRILMGMHNLNQRKVAYWSINTPICTYGVPDTAPFGSEQAFLAANMRTRLNSFTPSEVTLLLQLGYAGADASIRRRGMAANEPVVNSTPLGTLFDDAFRNS